MRKMQKLGAAKEKEKNRPKAAAFGIGGAGRNIISSFENKKFSNIDIYEVGEENRLDNFPSIKVFRNDIEKILTTKISDDYRDKTRSEKILEKKIKKYDILYILCGLGGSMGSGVSTICSKLCKKSSVFSVALYATPFQIESPSRRELSRKIDKKIKKITDVSVSFSNENLLKMNPHLSLKKAFSVMNKIISIPVEDLNNLITEEDLDRLKGFCNNVEGFGIGAGYGKGREKGIRASREAFNSPWLKNKDFDKVIALITRGENSSKYDIKDVLESIGSKVPESKIMYGVRKGLSIKERMRVTILAD